MSSPFRRGAELLALAALLVAGCDRESRPLQTKAPESGPGFVALGTLRPGLGPPASGPDPRGKDYEGVAYQIAQGQQYYTWFNCVGCHANGGGSIGPALMDDEWRYGGKMDEIYASIAQGRPNGMPSFQDKIPEQQIWQIAAYVRSLSGNAEKLAAPSRPDAMAGIPPINNMNKQPQRSEASGVQGVGP